MSTTPAPPLKLDLTRLDAVIREHRDHMRLRGLSASHIIERRRAIHRLARYLEKDPLTVTAPELQRWAVDFVPKVRQTPRGRHNLLSHIHCFYSWAAEHGHIDVDPSARIPRPKLTRLLPRPISEDDLRVAIQNADRRVSLWLTLAAFAGLRACEIARLERSDILDKAVPPVLIAHGKGSKDRVVPLNETVMAALNRYGLDRNDYGLRRRGPMFPRLDGQPGPTSAMRVSMVVNLYLHDLGIADTLHSLRHRFATETYRLSQDLRVVQELMGHESPQTTAGYAAYSRQGAVDTVRMLDQAAS